MRKKILVVDDEKDIVDFLERFLKKFSIDVIKTTSGNEAIDFYKKYSPEIVFLDINMPDIDGISVLKKLYNFNPSLKAIMITAIDEKSLQKKAKKYGAIDYITKPLDLTELRHKIMTYFK